jgi:membrane associated rhomboid family serine protease
MSNTYGEVSTRCYRHPDRESFVRCQRCGRTICAECQTQAAVGVHCPECVRQSRAEAPRSAPVTARASRWLNPSGGRPVITYGLIALCLLIFGIQYLTGLNASLAKWGYYPPYTAAQPWRMFTSIFIHGSVIHVLSNMFSLFVMGPALEMAIGRVRYLVLFVVAGFGGSVGVLLIAPSNTLAFGASGAIFGLFGAYFIIQRKTGGNLGGIAGLIVLNLVIGFVLPGIAWQAHVGGLVTGAAVAFVYLETRAIRRRPLQVVLVAAIALALVLITIVAVSLRS